MIDTIYPKGKEALLNGDIDWLLDDIRTVLIDLADYTYSAAHDFLDDVPAAARVGTPQVLGTKTSTNGAADAADATFPSVSGDQSEAILIYKHTGTEATSALIAILTGRQLVTAAAAAAGGATSVTVDPLRAAIASGATIAFSGGVTATLSSAAAAGARSIAVTALSGAIAAGETGEAAIQGTGLPVTPSGGNIIVAWAAAGIFSL